MKYIFFCTLPLLVSVSCTAPSTPQKQSLECYVRYLVPEGQLHAEATLREMVAPQNTPRPIAVPGGIRYQEAPMSAIQVQGTSYVLERPGGYTPRHEFSWQDAGAKTHRFTMDMSPVTSFSFGNGATLSREKPATFSWEGAPLEKGEALVFLWESIDRRLTVPMDVVGAPGQRSIDFPAVKLSELAPGRWTLYIVRKKLTQTNVDGIEASGVVEYYSQVDTLTVQ